MSVTKSAIAPPYVEPTVRFFRSEMLRICSLPNSSKHPTCTPARIVIGRPASSHLIASGANRKAKFPSSPCASARLYSCPSKCRTVNPSARSSSSAIYRGASQKIGWFPNRISLVSGGRSAASDFSLSSSPAAPTPASPAAPANAAALVRKRRRLWTIGKSSSLLSERLDDDVLGTVAYSRGLKPGFPR